MNPSFDFAAVVDLLVCPKSRQPFVRDENSLVSTDPATRLRYAIKDEIPILLIEEATELSSEDWTEIMRRNQRDPRTGAPA